MTELRKNTIVLGVSFYFIFAGEYTIYWCQDASEIMIDTVNKWAII